MHLVIRHLLAIFNMFRDGKDSEQALLGWSMLDHDDSANDIYDFDEYSSSSRRLPEDVHSDVVHASPSADVHFFVERKRDLQTRTVSALRLSEARAEPTGDPATQQKLPSDMRHLIPNTLASASWDTGLETNTWRLCFVNDRTQGSSIYGRSARRRRKTCNFQGNQCVIDESSSDDSVEGSSHNQDRATRARMAIDEITEDEINSSVDAEPTRLQPLCAGSPISQNAVQSASNVCDAQFSSIESPAPRQFALKNGFEERLLVSRQKESADLTLWKFYKENANFPKTFSRDAPETVTARILTLENVYGIAYCACEVDSLAHDISNVCLTLPLEIAEREKLDHGAVVRIYPPWREHTVLTYPEKIISGVQCFEVLERH
ncbi:uncharacterized protein LOC142566092 [Dermacentor variabilis]|uniref:uncharacterized protein LOC142566092 n=1 Tax=Dermacentor variabilis TaxID=34621 RepID=UPI003F5C26FC